MKDLVIVNSYDCGCWFSVMIDEKVYNTNNRSDLFDEILSEYNNDLTSDFEKYLKERFKNKNIIFCEDGDIKVIQKKQEAN